MRWAAVSTPSAAHARTVFAEAGQPGGDNRPDGPLFGECSIRYRQELCPALIVVCQGLGNLLDSLDAFEQAADTLLLDSDDHGSPRSPGLLRSMR